MSGAAIFRLVAKDVALMRAPLAAYTAAAAVAVVLALAGTPQTRATGVTLALNVLIGVSFHVVLGPVLGERERKTLPFVMSLPVTPREVSAGKMLSAFVLFVVPGVVAATALVALSPVDVFSTTAHSSRSVLSHVLGWTAYFGVVLGAWAAFFSVVLAAAIVTESIGWTIAVLTGTIFVGGNLAIQVGPTIGVVGRYFRDLARGGPALGWTLAVEGVAISAVVAATLVAQGRKSSFV